MTEKQVVELSMLETTDGICNDHADVIVNYPPLQNTYDLFSTKLEAIRELVKNQAYDPKGMTENKQAAKQNMAELGSELAKVGYAEGLENNDHKIMAYFDVSFSDIRFTPDNEAENTVKVIIDEMRKIPAERLDLYLTSTDDIDKLEGYLNTFTSSDTERSVAGATSVVATRDLAHMFKDIKSLLEHRMDIQVSKLRVDHPDFVNKYEKAREVLGLTKAKPSVSQDAL